MKEGIVRHDVSLSPEDYERFLNSFPEDISEVFRDIRDEKVKWFGVERCKTDLHHPCATLAPLRQRSGCVAGLMFAWFLANKKDSHNDCPGLQQAQIVPNYLVTALFQGAIT